MRKQGVWLIWGLVALTLAVVNVLIIFGSAEPTEEESGSVILPVEASNMAIQTNKLTYQRGEMVKITITNQAESVMAEQTESFINVRTLGNLGKNYGVGLIEQYNDGVWSAVEPIWRCAEACYSPCADLRTIEPGEKVDFLWPQTRLICHGQARNEKISLVPAGRYRITSALWNDEIGDYEQVYSNDFWIE